MIKKRIGLIVIIGVSVCLSSLQGESVQADNLTLSQIADDSVKNAVDVDYMDMNIDGLIDGIDDIDPNNLPPEPQASMCFKLRLLKEYLILQAELAKQHIVDHKQAYLWSSLITLGLGIGGVWAYIAYNKKPAP